MFEGWDQNSNVYKNKISIPMRIEIGPKYQYFKRKDNNFNVYKKGLQFQRCNDKIIIPVLTEIGPESQSFEE